MINKLKEHQLLVRELSVPTAQKQHRPPPGPPPKALSSTEQLKASNSVQSLIKSPSCKSPTRRRSSKVAAFPKSGIALFEATLRSTVVNQSFELFLEARPYRMQLDPSSPSFSSRILKHHQILNTRPKNLLIVGFRITKARTDTITMFTACNKGRVSKVEYGISSKEDLLREIAAMPPVAISTYHSEIGFLPI